MDILATRATWLAIAIFFITVVAAKISRWKSNVHSSSTRPLPPVVNVLPLLPSLLTKGLEVTIQDIYTKLGSVFTINLLGPKVTLLIGPEVSAHFFQGPESEINYGKFLEFTVPMFGPDVGFAVDAATLHDQRNFFLDALNPTKLRSHFDPMFEEVEAYFSRWGQDGIVDLKHELEQVLMLISRRCLLGSEISETMLDEIHSLFCELELGANMISFVYPFMPTPSNRRRDKAHIRLKEIFSAAVSSRIQAQEDALQKLIDSKYKDGRSTTIQEISGMMISLVFAAKHTSSHTSTWTGACLLSNPKVLMAAIEEQKHVISKHNNIIDYDALSDMHTLHSCIKEALRLHAAVPMLVRKAHKKFTVKTKEGKEYDIPGGHNVAIPTVFSGKLPYIYKNPDVYDPDRFGPGREEDKVGGKFSYTSFGGGRRACVGMNFAYQQIKLIWSHLLRNFDLKIISPFPEADWSKIAPEPKGKVMISYKRRKLQCN